MSHGNVNLVQSSEEFNILLETAGDKLVVVDFYATWCGPCKYIAPIYEQLSVEYKNVIFLKVDGDQLKEVTMQKNVRAYPTFKFFKNNQEVDMLEGASENDLRSKIEFHSSSSSLQTNNKKSPYQHFPETKVYTFLNKNDLTKISKKWIQTNAELSKENSLIIKTFTNTEINAINKIESILSNRSYYHSSTFDKSSALTFIDVLQNCIKLWPLAKLFPVLDILRQFALHHDAENYIKSDFVELLNSHILSKYNQLNGKFEEAAFEFGLHFIVNSFKLSNAKSLKLDSLKSDFILHLITKGTNNHKLAVSAYLLNLSILYDEKEIDSLLKLASLLESCLNENKNLEESCLTFFAVTIGTTYYKLLEGESKQENPLLRIDLSAFSKYEKLTKVHLELQTIFQN